MELKEVFDYIINDNEIKKIYKEVEKFEEKNKGWAYHNYNHVKNVMITATDILTTLKYDNDIIISAKIACLLHDTGARLGKDNHEIRSYEFAKEYFESHNMDFKNKDIILNAIKNHSNGFDSNDIITLTLIFSDKLDIKKNRISEEGKKVIGNRQYSHIEDIKVNIINNKLEINFISDNQLDIEEFKDYYFTKKVLKSIHEFAVINELDYRVLIDNVELD